VSATSLSPRTERARRLRLRRRTGVIRALVLRDWGVMRSYRTALISDLVFGFLNLIVYHFIARTLRPRVGNELGGAPTYFAYAAVGIAMMVVLQASIVGLGRRIREEQLTGTLETLLAQPIMPSELALGLAGFPFLFAVFRALAYLLMAGAFLGLSFAHTNWIEVLVSFAVSGMTFAGIGIVLASLVVLFKRAEALGAIGTFAMSLAGGAVFPASVLPSWLRPLSRVVPTRFAFNGVRDALFGAPGWAGQTEILLVYGLALMVVALALFRAALRLVIKLGTVSQY
jgi:ABC-type multidrug transport system permease subunit